MKTLSDADRAKIHARIFGKDGNDFDREQLEIYAAQLRAEHNDVYLGYAIELMLAGWTMNESPYPKGAVMGFYWRRPKREGTRDRKGKLFRSTDQAYRAMRAEKDTAGLSGFP